MHFSCDCININGSINNKSNLIKFDATNAKIQPAQSITDAIYYELLDFFKAVSTSIKHNL
jgi:hypothetical protein